MRYSAELITVGNELLKGSVVNTNAAFMGRELTKLGFAVTNQISCQDALTEIDEKLGDALVRSNLIILCGGLGPTPDDVTRDAIAEHFGVPLTFSKKQYAQIKKYYARGNKKVPVMVKKEAMFPQNAKPLINNHGIALGFTITYGKRMIIALPGVPSELRKMFRELVIPLLIKNFTGRDKCYSLTAKFVGISEPDVMRRLKKDFFNEKFEFGIYPGAGEIAIRLQADQAKIIRSLRTKIKNRFSSCLYALDEIDLVEVVSKKLTSKRKSIALAESCTGGKLAAEFTKHPGASRFFKGSVTAYSNVVKQKILGVDSKSISLKGAVSSHVAEKMAYNVRDVLGSIYGVGITGVAGPSGGTTKKPVGTVVIALSNGRKTKSWQHCFWGNREQIQKRAVSKTLEYLWRELK